MQKVGRPYLYALIAALVLILPVLLNGAAFFYEDSIGYVGKAVGPVRAAGLHLKAGDDWLAAAKHHDAAAAPAVATVATPAPQAAPMAPAAAPRVWIAGRSLVYSVATYLLYAAGGFTLVAFWQALMIAVPLALVWMRCLGLSGWSLIVGAAVLAVASSLPLFAGLVMPDYAAALIALIPAMLLAFGARLRSLDHVVLFALLAYAAMLHDSHVVVLAGMLALCAIVALLVRRQGGSAAWPWTTAFALLAAIFYLQAFALVARKTTGLPLMRLPHLTAHFAESPILSGYLARTCPGNGFLLCDYRNRLPVVWTDFLFGQHFYGGMDYAGQRRLSDQQVPLLIAMAKDRPVAVATFLAGDALRQVVLFSYLDLDQARKLPFFAAMPAPQVARIEASAVVRHPGWLDAQDLLQRVVVWLSLPALALIAWRLRGDTHARGWLLLAGIVCAGVVLNGLACGLLAFPYDRFQARVIWLLPFLALSGAALIKRQSSATITPPGGPFDA
ncbi:hypothetical protein [Sphingomonas nostoxanthinifaciens]|uniref:hypothetical protein n=1 Tax=Sphingomonas nostoxanthinifaciens TaxID=2872652 RepID=UPI001CC1D2C3|nr:hypothetical protein [Sphingomonas nostoxanthinifaciens]UAK23420.1 hypothetical protein K8P63_13575 [Sphingomonas nostoxanthinifaciens]